MKLMERPPPKLRRTKGNVSMKVLGHRAKRSRGSSPELYHPRSPLDTAPKGSRNPPPGTVAFPLATLHCLPSFTIYHAWHPHLAYAADLTEVNSKDKIVVRR